MGNKEDNISKILKDVSNSLEKKGYNAITQIVGYLMSGDIGYISNYNNVRNKLSSIDRTTLLEELVASYLNK